MSEKFQSASSKGLDYLLILRRRCFLVAAAVRFCILAKDKIQDVNKTNTYTLQLVCVALHENMSFSESDTNYINVVTMSNCI